MPSCGTRGASKQVKAALSSAPVLAHYRSEAETRLETDASLDVISGVLSQRQSDGEWYPVAFFLKTMQPAETRYDIHNREMVVIVPCFEGWRAELASLGHNRFDMFTDHRALEYIMTS